jgi:asparagine synthase (glutamine-hydrolysing)
MLEERLLDGALAAHGLIDRAAVERDFGDPTVVSDGRASRLLNLAEAEAWVHSWIG